MTRRRDAQGDAGVERAAASAASAAPPLPVGMPVQLDADVRRFEGGHVLLGGDPGRLLRLRPDGRRGLERLAAGRCVEPPVRALARTLVDGGLAHPRPLPGPLDDVTVVVPVRDRTDELARCLASVGGAVPVLVVDDGSRNPAAVARTCRAHGARVLHLPRNGGPGAARNAGVGATTTGLVAFLDSDCVAPEGWLSQLLGHFADPAVGAVAPRVRAAGRPPAGAAGPASAGATAGTLLAAYARDRGPLDLGPQEARVRPGGRVPYVPTAALVVRRAALAAVALPAAGPGDGVVFDPALRYGEDVDLVWRLHDAGWRVRYDPRTVVRHDEPARWGRWLERRHRYGTSAAPLGQRHGDRVTPLVASPLAVAAWLLLASGRPLRAVAVAAVPAARLHRQLHTTALAPRDCARTAVRVTGQALLATAGGLGGAGAVVTAPLLVALLGPRRTRRLAAVALASPPLLEWLARRPSLDPVRWTALRLVDDLAYASGVWRGCWSSRTTRPLRPRRTRPR